MTDAPPSRYRVVERGRRLEVIDTLADAPVSAIAPVSDRKRIAGPLPRRTRFDGGALWTTRPFYDDKGPRTLTLDPAAMTALRWTGIAVALAVLLIVGVAIAQPASLILLIAFAQPKLRTPLRKLITSRLDRIEACTRG